MTLSWRPCLLESPGNLRDHWTVGLPADSQKLGDRDWPVFRLLRVWGSAEDTGWSSPTQTSTGCSLGSAWQGKSLPRPSADLSRWGTQAHHLFLRGPRVKLHRQPTLPSAVGGPQPPCRPTGSLENFALPEGSLCHAYYVLSSGRQRPSPSSSSLHHPRDTHPSLALPQNCWSIQLGRGMEPRPSLSSDSL